jgi:hypothetical protein
MTCPNQSLVKMDPKEVVRIAEEYLAWAKEQKEIRYKKTIDEIRVSLTKNMNNRWLWWLRRDPTEQEVYNAFYVDDNDGWAWTRKQYIDEMYYDREKVARNLIKAGKIAKDEMYVSVDDLAKITQ